MKNILMLLLPILENVFPRIRRRRVHLEVAKVHFDWIKDSLTTDEQKQRMGLLIAELRAALSWPPRE